MSYVNADDVLPKILVKEIQKYVDGQLIYIPRKDENSLSWGEKNGTKEKLAERNQMIVNRYYSGQTIAELSKVYYLSEKRIQGIIHEYESSQKRMMEDSKLNRENKRKQYEKGYYKTHPCNETFICKNGGRMVVPEGAGSEHRNHCPNCLYSLHVDIYNQQFYFFDSV